MAMSRRCSNPYMTIQSLNSSRNVTLSTRATSNGYSVYTGSSQSTLSLEPPEVPLELQCPACNQLYESPVFLPCSHTFCKFCAAHLIETADPVLQERKRFLCPTCRNIIKYGSDGIESLPKNINIEQAAKRFKKEVKVRFPQCERHAEFHMESLMWCETCSINLCPLCALDDVHKNHKIAPITVLRKFKAVRRRLRGTTDALTGKIEKIGSNILQTEGVVTEMDDKGTELKHKVDVECNAMIAQIEKRRQAMYADIDVILEKKKGKRQKEIKGLRIEFNQARELLHQIQDVLQTDGPTDFLKKLDDVGLSSKVEEINKLVT